MPDGNAQSPVGNVRLSRYEFVLLRAARSLGYPMKANVVSAVKYWYSTIQVIML